MNMKGVTKYYESGKADAKAFEAGNDVIDYVTNVDSAIIAIRNLLKTKKITKEDISARCRKILAAKYWAGLNKNKIIKKENIENDLSPGMTKALIREYVCQRINSIE